MRHRDPAIATQPSAGHPLQLLPGAVRDDTPAGPRIKGGFESKPGPSPPPLPPQKQSAWASHSLRPSEAVVGYKFPSFICLRLHINPPLSLTCQPGRSGAMPYSSWDHLPLQVPAQCLALGSSCGLSCMLPKFICRGANSAHQNVTEFGNRVFAELIG